MGGDVTYSRRYLNGRGAIVTLFSKMHTSWLDIITVLTDLHQARGICKNIFESLYKDSRRSETHKENNKDQLKSNQSRSAILHVAQETEDIKEEIDEIEVETNCPHDVFVGGEAAVDEVRVVDDVSAEQKCSHKGVYKIHSRAEWDKDSDEAGHHCAR